MDNTRMQELQAIYENNTNKGQKTKIIMYDTVFLLLAIIGAVILFAVNYAVSLLGGKLWVTLFAVVAVILFVFSHAILKKLPFINKKKFLLWCVLFSLVVTGIVWLVFFIIRLVSDVYTGEKALFMYTNVKDWMIIPLCYSLMTLGLIIVSFICFKKCKRCYRSGFGIASRCDYIIEKITKEHVDSVRREKPTEVFGEVDVYYDVYYKNYEYRFYRHYCSVCGNVIYEKMRKVKSRKKYLSTIPTFTEAEELANEKRIISNKECFAKKEAKAMEKLYAIIEKENKKPKKEKKAKKAPKKIAEEPVEKVTETPIEETTKTPVEATTPIEGPIENATETTKE